MGRRISNENVEKKIFLSVVFLHTATTLIFLEKFHFSDTENTLFLRIKQSVLVFLFTIFCSKIIFSICSGKNTAQLENL